MDQTKIILPESEMPQRWYNINPDLPAPLSPPLNPETGQPIGPEDLAPIFPMELIKQEVSMEPWIEIPDDLLRIYKLWRPSPLYRAHRLEEYLGTPARIYYKNESFSPAGSHKPNTAVAQAYYNKQEGVRRICTETGAGQWGSGLALGGALFDIDITVYMVKCSYEQKPYRRMLMEAWGAECFPSPTDKTNSGRAILEKDPDSPGSLGIAISEAVEDAATHDDAKYSLGSVLNHVLLHQTIVGLELKKQLAMVDEKLDTIVGCVGGGSNFAGQCFPFVKDKLDGQDIDIIATEPTACPTLTRAPFRYDFGDTAQLTPLLKMYTLGHTFVPPPIHAGGLRYHGDAPLMCLLVNQGVIEARAFHQNEVFEAAITFARTEGSLPAPETAHAVKASIDEALKCKETGEEKCIVIAYSGHGFFDLGAYDVYLSGELVDYELPEEEIQRALAEVPEISEPS
ncbi:MAG: TrpB-like pyridoxal phosphate-dependent enzyme [Armatimonadetes bacterium]|nr:TrpB-like pyridoxal phosphate-dependent enzyme [Armatimonadota bacterium]